MSPDYVLFDGNDALFKKIIFSSSVYGEYGLGNSTRYVYHNTNAHIIGVESSPEWHKNISNELTDLNRTTLIYVNVGNVGRFGMPTDNSKQGLFPNYPKALWESNNVNKSPDFVLIDGRFRVACFLTTLLHAKQGTLVLFDDYTPRKVYHIVEEFVKPVEKHKRQALFIMPEKKDENSINEIINKYVSHTI